MEVRNLIKPNAVLVQITEIGRGDVYKRLEKPSYGEPKVVFGSVIDVLNNGEESTLVALEFTPESYGPTINATVKVFNGQMEVTLFPCTIEEYKESLDLAIASQNKAVGLAEADYQAKLTVLNSMIDQSRIALSIPKMSAVES